MHRLSTLRFLLAILSGLYCTCAAAQPERGFKIAVAADAPAAVKAAARQVLDAANSTESPALLRVFAAQSKHAELTDSAALLAAKLPERAYNHLILIGLPDDPMIGAAWQREARAEAGGFYIFGWGHIRGDIGYIESDRNPFLHSAAIASAPYETEIVTLTGSTPRGVQLAVDAFLKHGVLNGTIAATGWTRPKTSLLDREPLVPEINLPDGIPPMTKEATLLGVTAGGEDEARGVLADTGVEPTQIWRAKYFLPGAWDGKGAAGAFDNYSFGLHRRAYGNTLWMAQFTSVEAAQQAAPKIATAARLNKTGTSWSGSQPPYADGKYFGDKASSGPIRLWQQGTWVFISTLPSGPTAELLAKQAPTP